MILLLAAMAHAACPCEGFRVTTVAAGRSVFTRVALVEDFDGAFYQELTLGGQTWAGRFGFATELAATSGFSEGWTGYGLGNVVLDARDLVDRTRRHALGVRVHLPAGAIVQPDAPVTWWGTVPDATVPLFGVALAYEGSVSRFTWAARLGGRGSGLYARGYTTEVIDAAAALAMAQPLAGDWLLVTELEAMNAPSPVHLRALARYAQPGVGPRWTVDAGLAAPLVTIGKDPTLQVIGQVRHSF